MRVTKRMQPAVLDPELLEDWPQSLLHDFVRVVRNLLKMAFTQPTIHRLSLK